MLVAKAVVLAVKAVTTVRKLYAEMLKFGVVGAVGVVADVSSSNLLWKFTGLGHTVASVGGTMVATVTAYLGNRYWVFRHRPSDARRREMALFALISLIGLVIENSFVFVADHTLGFHSILAANIAKFIFGLPVAGVFRFTTSHLLVFPETVAARVEAAHSGVGNGSGGSSEEDAARNGGEQNDFSAQSPTAASAP
ncbi:MAG: GtrA family protein [Catenulispora sp.]|nr:GtrA family protein [Catenulispora sp.]